jgi:hypothetical protein
METHPVKKSVFKITYFFSPPRRLISKPRGSAIFQRLFFTVPLPIITPFGTPVTVWISMDWSGLDHNMLYVSLIDRLHLVDNWIAVFLESFQ